MRSLRIWPGARTLCFGTLGALTLLACAPASRRQKDSSEVEARQTVDDSARLARLEGEVRALVRTTGCATGRDCRVAPIGWRGCGGPRAYVVYCPATTDSAALATKLEVLRLAEVEHNEKSGAVSTCELRSPPEVEVQGGRCTASR